MYYMTPDWDVMVVEITTTPTFHAGTPTLLFKSPAPFVTGRPEGRMSVSRNGQRFAFTINVPVSISTR